MTTRLDHLRALARRHSDDDLGAALSEALTMLDAAEARALMLLAHKEAMRAKWETERDTLRARVAELERMPAQLRAEVVT